MMPSGEKSIDDPEFDRVVAAWPTLPTHLRAAILALIQTAR
jgi:hypothetical protein